MKRNSSPDSARGLSLRIKMTLLFLSSSATILLLSLISLALLLQQDGTLQLPQIFQGVRFFHSASYPFLLVLLPAAAGIVLTAWLSYAIIGSLTGSLASCTRLAQGLRDGRFDEHAPPPGNAETAPLAEALNGLAAELKERLSRIETICGALATIDGALETGRARMTDAFRRQESDMRRLVPEVVRMEQSMREIAAATEGLLPAASSATDTSRALISGGEQISTLNDSLALSLDETVASLEGVDGSARKTEATISELLTISGAATASANGLDAAIRQSEQWGQGSRAIAEGITRDAETGRRAAGEAVAGLQAIRTASTTTAETIASLSRRAQATDGVLGVIEELAEQTDLLALNATIIAAQAGDLGKDFSMVADEIRDLSERTASATREIATIIHGIREESRRAADAVARMEERIDTGERLTRNAGMSLEMIVGGVQQAALQVGGMAQSGLEQARISREITDILRQAGEMGQRLSRLSAERLQQSELPVAMLEHTEELAAQMRSLIRAQRHSTLLLHQAAESVTGGLRQLRDAGSPLPAGATQATAVLATLQAATASSNDGLGTLDPSLTALGRQVRLLKEELSGFRS